MKRVVRYALTSIASIPATLLLAHLWLTNPDQVPRFPETLWIWLIGIYGAQDGEDLANLELLIALAVSFLLVMAVSFVAAAIWRRR